MKKKNIILLAFLGVFWFLLLVVNKMPAAMVVNYIAEQTGGFVPSHVNGTIWQGEASMRITSLAPNLEISKAKWDISPLKLFLGEFDAFIDLKDGSRYLSGDVQFDFFDQDIRLLDMKGRFDTALIQPYLALPIKVDGIIDIDLKEVEIVDKKPAVLDGRLLVESLSIDTGQVIQLGTFVVDLGLVEGQPIADIKLQDVDAVVELSGKAQFTAGFDYYANLLIKPKPVANPLIASTLEFASYQPDERGFYKVVIGKPLVKK